METYYVSTSLFSTKLYETNFFSGYIWHYLWTWGRCWIFCSLFTWWDGITWANTVDILQLGRICLLNSVEESYPLLAIGKMEEFFGPIRGLHGYTKKIPIGLKIRSGLVMACGFFLNNIPSTLSAVGRTKRGVAKFLNNTEGWWDWFWREITVGKLWTMLNTICAKVWTWN